MGIQLTANQSNFYRRLWGLIDRHIENNPFLAEYGRVGQVFFRFTVDTNGRLVDNSLRVSANDRVLKVIAARAIRKALLDEAQELPTPNEVILVNAQFIWGRQTACHGKHGFKARFLSFCHQVNKKERKTFSTSEKVATWGKAIIDHGPWAYEAVKDYNAEKRRRKSGFDPFESYELDQDWNL